MSHQFVVLLRHFVLANKIKIESEHWLTLASFFFASLIVVVLCLFQLLFFFFLPSLAPCCKG